MGDGDGVCLPFFFPLAFELRRGCVCVRCMGKAVCVWEERRFVWPGDGNGWREEVV